MATKKTIKAPLTVETLKHDDATRKNIPTAEYPRQRPAACHGDRARIRIS